MAAVSVLMKPASGLCNMACDYCFYCDESGKRERASYGMMSEDTLRNVIRRTMLNATGAVSFAYQGGEPSLRGLDFYRKAVELQKHYNRSCLKVHNAFQTNGYALDENWCRFFKENRFLIGLSVDGTRETHDLYRRDPLGGGTFDRVTKTAGMFDECGVEYNILTVVTGTTAENIREIYRAYKKRGWHYQQYIVCLDPLGEKRGSGGYSLTPEKYGRFLCDLFSLWYEDVKGGDAPCIRQFENYVGIFLGYPPEACDQCGVCGVQYAVEADGSVYPCDFYMLDEYRLGNFNTDRFAFIAARRKEIGFVERSTRLKRECLECRWHPLCRGGCQRHRETVPGENTYANFYCQGYRMFFERYHEALEQIALSVRRKQAAIFR
ncbi:MAG: anaerobic sulfatase maturase [Clostridia bacterium]|nr:anaerobic sulfatase maturase [Clostridia bacterium]